VLKQRGPRGEGLSLPRKFVKKKEKRKEKGAEGKHDKKTHMLKEKPIIGGGLNERRNGGKTGTEPFKCLQKRGHSTHRPEKLERTSGKGKLNAYARAERSKRDRMEPARLRAHHLKREGLGDLGGETRGGWWGVLFSGGVDQGQ